MATNETVKVVRKVLRAREQKATRASDAVDAGDTRARATATNDELDATATVAAREEAYRLARERIFGDGDEGEGDDDEGDEGGGGGGGADAADGDDDAGRGRDDV